MSCLYILEANPLPVALFENVFSHSEGCLFVLFMVFCAMQKLLTRPKSFIEKPHNPTILLLGIHPEKTTISNDRYISMLIEALFAIVYTGIYMYFGVYMYIGILLSHKRTK